MLGRTTKLLLSRHLPRKTVNKLLCRTYSINESKSLRSGRSSSYRRDVSLTILGGGILLLSYSYLTLKTEPLYLDSINAIRDFSTGMINKAEEDKNKTILILDENEIDSKLRNCQESHFINRGKGIFRYDVSQLPSNHPIEDNHMEQIITIPHSQEQNLVEDLAEEDDLYFFGVFDGHSGAFTSSKLRTDLVKYVANQLGKVYANETDLFASPTGESFDEAIKTGFLTLDNDIIHESFRKLFKDPTNENMIGTLPAISGSCALLTVYNSLNSTLKVAVTGDSRALIGGLDKDGKWVVESLSVDQTGDNIHEVERIRNEHPNEPNVIRNGRILGCLQPSRAFGDYRYKLNKVDGKALSELPDHVKIYFRKEPRDFKTPPYVTAEPVITTTKITPNTKFMVLGSDGLFELLNNEQIAALVIRWMEKNMDPKLTESNIKTPTGKLPEVKDLSTDLESQRPPFRYMSQDKKRNYAKDPEYFIEDSNVATHLIRNALSSAGSKEYVSTLVSIPSPMSRRYRDDLTVTVAFFGDSGNDVDGSLVTNIEATTAPKPKL